MSWSFGANPAKAAGVTWKNSIFMRITVTFVIILLPLYTLGILIYNSALVSVRNEISGSMISQVTFYMDSLEKEVQRIKYLEYDMVNDTYLDKLSAIPQSMDDIEKIQAVKNLQNRIVAVRNSSMYISNLTVYVPSVSRAVTDRGMDKLDTAEYGDVIAAYDPTAEIQYMGGTPVIFTRSSYVNPRTNIPMFMIKLELSRQAFADALQQFNKYPGSGSFLIDSQTGMNIGTAGIDADVERRIIEKGGQQGILSGRDGTSGMYILTKSDELGMTLAMYVPEDVVFSPLREYRVWFWIFTCTAAAIICVFSLSIYRFIHRPLIELVDAFKKVKRGDLHIAIEHRQKDEFRYLYGGFNEMVEQLGVLIDQVYKQKILAQNAQLKQLQSQINPHFLYNSYFILNRMVLLEDHANAIKFSEQLGTYLKFITRNATDDVLLSSEAEHARIYAEIQAMRFANRIGLQFGGLPEEYGGLYVPRLILQPLIENAFEHGLENKVAGGMLLVSFQGEGEALLITVEDNGDGIDDRRIRDMNEMLHEDEEVSPMENTGIINIHRRLRYRFGEGSGLGFFRSEIGGLKAVIRISVPGGK